jgi:uroporphyrinogen III methyltransferase/synthase
MGMRNLDEIVERLVAGGRSAATPAAAVMAGTLPTQRVVSAPLGELAAAVEAAGLGAPAVVVVGEVVSLREALAWYERQPLFGRRVLVTRSAAQAGELIDALARAGAEGVLAPMLQLTPPDDPAPLDAALARLEGYDELLFTSANAVRFTAERAAARGVALADAVLRVVCVGPKTAQAALEAGLPVHRVPPARFDADALLADRLADSEVRGRRFLIPASDLARDVLPSGLRAAGAEVDVVVAYANRPGDVDAGWLRGELVRGALDVLTFASPSAVRRFRALLDDAALAAARSCRIAAIGPLTARALDDAGLPAGIVARSATAAGLVEELAADLAAAREGA